VDTARSLTITTTLTKTFEQNDTKRQEIFAFFGCGFWVDTNHFFADTVFKRRQKNINRFQFLLQHLGDTNILDLTEFLV